MVAFPRQDFTSDGEGEPRDRPDAQSANAENCMAAVVQGAAAELLLVAAVAAPS